MWIHPDLVDGQQWTTVTNRKSKGKAKTSSCNAVCASSREPETDIPSLTDSEEETIVLATEPNQLVAETRSGQSYLKKYGANSSKTRYGISQALHKAARGETKRASVFQSSLKRQRGRIHNTLPL